MTILMLLIPLSMVLLGTAVWAFFWAVEHKQFDDLDRQALDILGNDDITKRQIKKEVDQ